MPTGYLTRLKALREQRDAIVERTAPGLPGKRAVEWLRALGQSFQAADVPKEKADLMHAVYERITVAGPEIVGVRLTAAAYAHGLALALPEKVEWKRWCSYRFGDQWLWKWFVTLSLICVPLVGIASTAVDRVALYFAPIQLVVWSRSPVLISNPALRGATVVTILFTYGLVLWVWLNYAIHAPWWIPYKNVLFQ